MVFEIVHCIKKGRGMNIRNKLLALGMAATALSADAAQQKPHASSAQMEVLAQQEDSFLRHLKKLQDNVSGATFSFGDAALIRKALYGIAQTPHGRNLLMQVPDNLPISSQRNLPFSSHAAAYNTTQNNLIIRSNQIESDNTILGVSNSVMKLLSHELRHAAQDARGLFMEGKHPSVEQAITISKLSEAETRAWDIVGRVSHNNLNFDSNGHAKNVKEFLNEKLEPSFQDNDILFQKNLRQANGNVEKAQKAMVGQQIKEAMSLGFDKDYKWREIYDAQSFRFALHSIFHNNISANGNEPEFDKALKYYETEYGVKAQTINRPNLSKDFEKMGKDLSHYVRTGKMTEDLSIGIQKLANGTLQTSYVSPPTTPEITGHMNVNHKGVSVSMPLYNHVKRSGGNMV